MSAFLDSELASNEADSVRMHLAVCEPCAAVCEDLASIYDVCKTEGPETLAPPNSPAMWLRISNVIESEQRLEKPPVEPRRRIWRLTLPQLATAMVAIAVISSLLTVAGIRNYQQTSDLADAGRTSASQTTVEKLLGKVGLIDTPQQARERRLKEQQAAIDYWNARVSQRRAQWNPKVREAFDRNLLVIDQSLVQYTDLLEQDPEDDLSSEMLDSVMTDKMNLLRDFSDL